MLVAAADGSRDSPNSRDSRVAGEDAGVVATVVNFLGTYVAMPLETLVVVAAWVVASYLMEHWDRFPHLAVTSPEKRCGKTTFLKLLALIVHKPYTTANISPAAIYRLIDRGMVTLMIDEAQSLARGGSETSLVVGELLKASIDRGDVVVRVGGKNNDEVKEFSTYCPKVVALIGKPDSVLGDRCILTPMERKSADSRVQRYFSRDVDPVGEVVRLKLETWVADNGDRVADAYGKVVPFDIDNDRTAELLLPLQAVAEVDDQVVVEAGGVAGIVGFPEGARLGVEVLRRYAEAQDREDADEDRMSPGVMVLNALREVFETYKASRHGEYPFLPTVDAISYLLEREEEPWGAYSHGRPITKEGLANLLRPYGIRSTRNTKQSARGYVATDFAEAFARYLPGVSANSATSPCPAGGDPVAMRKLVEKTAAIYRARGAASLFPNAVKAKQEGGAK